MTAAILYLSFAFFHIMICGTEGDCGDAAVLFRLWRFCGIAAGLGCGFVRGVRSVFDLNRQGRGIIASISEGGGRRSLTEGVTIQVKLCRRLKKVFRRLSVFDRRRHVRRCTSFSAKLPPKIEKVFRLRSAFDLNRHHRVTIASISEGGGRRSLTEGVILG